MYGQGNASHGIMHTHHNCCDVCLSQCTAGTVLCSLTILSPLRQTSFAIGFERFCHTHAIINGSLDFFVCGGERGAHLGWVKDAAPWVLQCNATKAMLTLGGNYLNNADCQPDQLAKDILNVARSLIRVSKS